MIAASIGILIVAGGALILAALTLRSARTERQAARADLRERADDRAKLLEGIAADRAQLLNVIQEQAAQIMYLANHPWQTPPVQVPDTPRLADEPEPVKPWNIGTLADDADLPALSAFEA